MRTAKKWLDSISVLASLVTLTWCKWCPNDSPFLANASASTYLMWSHYLHVTSYFELPFTSSEMALWHYTSTSLWGLTLAFWLSAYFTKCTMIVFIIFMPWKIFRSFSVISSQYSIGLEHYLLGEQEGGLSLIEFSSGTWQKYLRVSYNSYSKTHT